MHKVNIHQQNQQRSSCPHVTVIGDYIKEDIIRKQELSKCDSCEDQGPFLWVCLHRDCLYSACGEASTNHRLRHYEEAREHCIYLNLTSLRVVCLLCEGEVFLENNDPPLAGMITTHQKLSSMQNHDSDSEEDPEVVDENLKPRGLTGLQNLGNTCYMNSAIQALSNCPQLTCFFLECGAFVRSEKKPGLSKSYMRLVQEMWHKRRPSYVVPSGIAYGIKMVFPVFRGFMQQDAQEFLRCFMDQLHEELKEPLVETPGFPALSNEGVEDFDSCITESTMGASEDSSQSDGDFETCDSGLSSEKSSCIDDSGDMQDYRSLPQDDIISNYQQCNNPSQVFPAANKISKSSEMAKEMKDSTNFAQQQAAAVVGDTGSRFSHSDGSDSGLHRSIAVDFSENGSPADRRSPNAVPKFDNYSDYTKCNHSSFCGHQCGSHGRRRSLSPHSIGSSMPRRRKLVQYRSIISDTFDGKILSSVQCLTCDTISTTKETFQDLSLPIPNRDHLHMIHASQGNQHKALSGGTTCTDVYSQQGWFTWFFTWMLSWFWGPAVSLQDCLAAFFSADELKGDNMYSCEKCKKLRNGIKYSKVLQLPEVLCIHLKRFRHEVMFSSKISNYVSFPLEGLDMSGFLHKSYPSNVTTYDLAAVICHHGTAGSGHYTSYALNALNDQWYEFDDQYVTAVDPQVVQNCEAYVLFYRKATEEIIKKRLRAVELMERSKTENSILHFHISKQWVNKFNTFAEPGPITNTDFLCIHGGVSPNRAPYVEDLCTVLPQAVWEYLHHSFGGGPSCTHLYICPVCQAEQEALNLRRNTEHDQFVALNNEFQAHDNPSVIYAISVSWFKLWESFVRGKDVEAPGPIDNFAICHVKGNQAFLKLGSDYGSLSEDMWRFLQGIYGGGPEILIQQNVTTTCCPQQQTQVPQQPPHSCTTSSRSSSAGSTNSPVQVKRTMPQSDRANSPSQNVSLNHYSVSKNRDQSKSRRITAEEASTEKMDTKKSAEEEQI